MVLGIVGSEGAKFTPETEMAARELIISLIENEGPSLVVSGACHLGGIDVWAEEEAKALGVPFQAYPPAIHRWEGGYKQRNLRIAKASDKVVCITLRELPESYKGMTFGSCYHCKTSEHVKSGGCWTVKQAKLLGKDGEVLVI
jgi:hypothetical protein